MSVKIGDVFGDLTVTRRHIIKEKEVKQWHCTCICGNIVLIQECLLLCGNRTSCGCKRKRHAATLAVTYKSQFKHGLTGDIFWATWQTIKQRCYNSNCKDYPAYGGLGITMYEPWIENYFLFKLFVITELGERPSKKHTIDRIRGKEGYHPGNLRWADKKTQSRNRTDNRKLTYQNKEYVVTELAEIAQPTNEKITGDRIWERVTVLKWSVEDAMFTPPRKIVFSGKFKKKS